MAVSTATTAIVMMMMLVIATSAVVVATTASVVMVAASAATTAASACHVLNQVLNLLLGSLAILHVDVVKVSRLFAFKQGVSVKFQLRSGLPGQHNVRS